MKYTQQRVRTSRRIKSQTKKKVFADIKTPAAVSESLTKVKKVTTRRIEGIIERRSNGWKVSMVIYTSKKGNSLICRYSRNYHYRNCVTIVTRIITADLFSNTACPDDILHLSMALVKCKSASRMYHRPA